MALITISGYPSSGKSTRAAQLKALLNERLNGTKEIIVLSDDSLNLQRTVYTDSRLEKSARGTLFTTIQRSLSQENIVIVDSLNYIKGFRYQIYCAARELKIRLCTLYVVAPPEKCRQWNLQKPPELQYPTETLENLFARYEEPSSMVRWDSPLFTILWSDDQIPVVDIYRTITTGDVKPPNSGTLNAVKAPIDALLILEKTTLAMVSSIMNDQSMGQLGPTTISVTPSLSKTVVLPERNITLSELQRLKRQFISVHKKAVTLGTTEKGAVNWDEADVADKFAMYLQDHLR